MNAQESRNHLALEELKRSLRGGSITEDELKARLLRIIEQEEQKGPARMDTAFISSCENLLWALHAPQTQTIRSSKREAYLRLREGMRTQRPAARAGARGTGVGPPTGPGRSKTCSSPCVPTTASSARASTPWVS